MMKLLPISLSMLIWTSCAHYKVIDADKTVRRLKAQQPFTAPVDGWFIPDGIHYTSGGYEARARLIAEALAKAFPASGATAGAGCVVR